MGEEDIQPSSHTTSTDCSKPFQTIHRFAEDWGNYIDLPGLSPLERQLDIQFKKRLLYPLISLLTCPFLKT